MIKKITGILLIVLITLILSIEFLNNAVEISEAAEMNELEDFEKEEKELLLEKINDLKNEVPKYYKIYCTKEKSDTIEKLLEAVEEINSEIVSKEELQVLYDELVEALDKLEYKTMEIPQVYITTDEGNGNGITKADGYVIAQIVIANAENGYDLLEGSGKIKVRGNSTANGAKKPFTIKFDEKQDVLGMGKAKKWALLADCFDPTLLRNYLAIEFAHELRLDYTSEQRYVELWLDGVFKGCYILIEPVEAGSSRVDIDIDSGEFLVEYEAARWESDVTYIQVDDLRFALSEPEIPTMEQLENVQSVLDEAVSALDSGDYMDVKRIIDVESFAKFYLLNEYWKTVDIGYSSAYFYYQEGKLHAGPPWDFDLSTGNASAAYYSDECVGYENLWTANVHWFKRLLKYEEFCELVKSLFAQEKEYMQALYAKSGRIDELLDMYGNAFERNFTDAGWEVSGWYSIFMRVPDSTYEENVETFRSWLSNRYIWLEENWNTWANNNAIYHSFSAWKMNEEGNYIRECDICGEISNDDSVVIKGIELTSSEDSVSIILTGDIKEEGGMAEVTGYKVYVYNDVYIEQIDNVHIFNNMITIMNLESETSYTYFITAVNEDGQESEKYMVEFLTTSHIMQEVEEKESDSSKTSENLEEDLEKSLAENLEGNPADDSPNTGDHLYSSIYIELLFISVIGIIVVVYRKRKEY